MMSGAEEALFWVLGPLAVLASLGLLFARKAVHAALSMVLVMISLGVIYIAQDAPFVGIIQIFVYSGAVMMLFLFVVMLVGVNASEPRAETIGFQRPLGLLGGVLLAAVLLGAVSSVDFGESVGLLAANAVGNPTAVAFEIFGDHVWVFEALASLLVIATIAAMVLAHTERDRPRRTQAELAADRFRKGRWLAGKPAPGVYARHNAVDTPALLPDGSIAPDSVNRVLQARDQVARPEDFDLEHEADPAVGGRRSEVPAARPDGSGATAGHSDSDGPSREER